MKCLPLFVYLYVLISFSEYELKKEGRNMEEKQTTAGKSVCGCVPVSDNVIHILH